MNLFFISRRFRRLNFPGALLLGLLQRTPVVRVVVAAESAWVASPVANVVRSAIAAVAALGAIDSMAGATNLTATAPSTATGITVNQGDSVNVVFDVTGTQTEPGSWNVSGGTFPGGLDFSGLTRSGTVNVQNLNLKGTATQAGTFSVTITAFQGINGTLVASPQYSYTVTVNPGANTAPSISTQPSDQNVTVGGTANFSVSASGTPAPTFQWRKDGNAISGATNSSYSITNVSVANAGAYSVVVTNSVSSVTSSSAHLNVGPTITTQPQAQTASTGGSATFTVAATGSPAPTYQWTKGGANIGGATNASLSLNNVSAADAGSYAVVVAETGFSALTSSSATLTVTAAPTAPTFTQQPNGQGVLPGATVVLTGAVSSSSSVTYQWKKNGVALTDGGSISGSTTATLTITGIAAGDAGTYTLVATNSTGATTSNDAAISLGSAGDPGRMINMSVNTTIGGGESFTVGYVLGGSGTSGNKPMLMRAMGPTLTAFHVNPVLPNPYIEFYNESTLAATNEDWGGDTTISNVASAIGAFGFISADSKDAALFSAAVPSTGKHSLNVVSHDNGSGTVIAEIYDGTSGNDWTTTTPRLINISVRKNVGSLTTLGFSITGSTSVKVLIRAVGPGLAPFGIPNRMDDPKLALYVLGAQAPFDTNDDWGGAANIQAAMDATGAFGIPANSKDAALLEIVTPGQYTAQVTPASGNTGTAILEVYEVPN